MYKVILDLGFISKQMVLKASVMVKEDAQIKQLGRTKNIEAIHSFMMGGAEYLALRPHSYLTIDINKTKDKNDTWNSGLSVNLNTMGVFLLQKKLRKILEGFKVKELFFKQSGHLYVNQSIANAMNEYVRTSTKTIKLAYAVVPDEENAEVEYEGIAFMINSVENYCYLTYEEIEFLLYTLNKIDLQQIALHSLSIYLLNLLTNGNTQPEAYVKPFQEEIPPVYPEKQIPPQFHQGIIPDI